MLLPPTRSLVRAKRSLAALPGGGGTPLAAGIAAGFAMAEEPPAQRYLAPAIPSVLRHAGALVLLHEDKHAPLLALYAAQELPDPSVIAPIARDAGALYVPFDIPPMLARWDRAIWDLQQRKSATIADVLGEEGFASNLSKDDLEYLFSED